MTYSTQSQKLNILFNDHCQVADLDIGPCIKTTAAPDLFKQAMSAGTVPIFGKKKSYLKKKTQVA